MTTARASGEEYRATKVMSPIPGEKEQLEGYPERFKIILGQKVNVGSDRRYKFHKIRVSLVPGPDNLFKGNYNYISNSLRFKALIYLKSYMYFKVKKLKQGFTWDKYNVYLPSRMYKQIKVLFVEPIFKNFN